LNISVLKARAQDWPEFTLEVHVMMGFIRNKGRPKLKRCFMHREHAFYFLALPSSFYRAPLISHLPLIGTACPPLTAA